MVAKTDIEIIQEINQWIEDAQAPICVIARAVSVADGSLRAALRSAKLSDAMLAKLCIAFPQFIPTMQHRASARLAKHLAQYRVRMARERAQRRVKFSEAEKRRKAAHIKKLKDHKPVYARAW